MFKIEHYKERIDKSNSKNKLYFYKIKVIEFGSVMEKVRLLKI